jgi:hypothetical protein
VIAGFGWEEAGASIAGVVAVVLIVLLILHEPRRSRVRVGVFLERDVKHRDEDDEGEDEKPTRIEKNEGR